MDKGFRNPTCVGPYPLLYDKMYSCLKKKKKENLQINEKGGINVILFHLRKSLVASDSLAKGNNNSKRHRKIQPALQKTIK